MFEKKRMHPISVILFILKNIKDAVLPIIFMFILGGSGEDASTLDLLFRFGIPSVIIFLQSLVELLIGSVSLTGLKMKS